VASRSSYACPGILDRPLKPVIIARQRVARMRASRNDGLIGHHASYPEDAAYRTGSVRPLDATIRARRGPMTGSRRKPASYRHLIVIDGGWRTKPCASKKTM
jgi:hypothetical protein